MARAQAPVAARAALTLMILLAALAAAVAVRAAPSYFRIGTGSIAGTYFPVGEALAAILSQPAGAPPCDRGGRCGVPGLIATAQATEGSRANVERVDAGELEAGLAQATVVDDAFYGHGVPKAKNIRVIANLYPESVHVVVARAAKIAKIRDLKGKRVSIDQALSGTAADVGMILKAYGLQRSDLKLVEDSPVKAADQLANGKIDAFFFIGGFPAALISDLAERVAIDLIAIDGPQAKKIVKANPAFSLGAIPAEAYRGLAPVETIQVGAQLIVNAKVEADLIYAITAKLWDGDNGRALAQRHPKAALIKLDTALTGLTIPLHPGAERYYRDKGMVR